MGRPQFGPTTFRSQTLMPICTARSVICTASLWERPPVAYPRGGNAIGQGDPMKKSRSEPTGDLHPHG